MKNERIMGSFRKRLLSYLSRKPLSGIEPMPDQTGRVQNQSLHNIEAYRSLLAM